MRRPVSGAAAGLAEAAGLARAAGLVGEPPAGRVAVDVLLAVGAVAEPAGSAGVGAPIAGLSASPSKGAELTPSRLSTGTLPRGSWATTWAYWQTRATAAARLW
jgi:hypothetical protein